MLIRAGKNYKTISEEVGLQTVYKWKEFKRAVTLESRIAGRIAGFSKTGYFSWVHQEITEQHWCSWHGCKKKAQLSKKYTFARLHFAKKSHEDEDNDRKYQNSCPIKQCCIKCYTVQMRTIYCTPAKTSTVLLWYLWANRNSDIDGYPSYQSVFDHASFLSTLNKPA